MNNLLPVHCYTNEEKIACVDKKNYKFGTHFDGHYFLNKNVVYRNVKDYLQSTSCPAYVRKTKFITIFHVSRCRSTLLLRDLFLSGQFNTVNEPIITSFNTDHIHFDLLDRIINHSSKEKVFCLKSGMNYNFSMADHIYTYPNSSNYFIYRDPTDVFKSTILDPPHRLKKLANDIGLHGALEEIATQIILLFRISRPLIELGHITPLSYSSLGNLETSIKVINDFGLDITDNTIKKISESRRYSSKAPSALYSSTITNKFEDRKDLKVLTAALLDSLNYKHHWNNFLKTVQAHKDSNQEKPNLK